MTGQRQEFTKEFRREAVRLSRESGRTIREIAEDLGVALSTLSRWRREEADAAPLPVPDDPHKELARLRRENEVLRQERDLLKKQRPSSWRRQNDEVSVHCCAEGQAIRRTVL